MQISEIHAKVAERLGGPVAPSSVRSYLQIGRGSHIVKVGRGTYASRTRQK
jgi:hypothetical protein